MTQIVPNNTSNENIFVKALAGNKKIEGPITWSFSFSNITT